MTGDDENESLSRVCLIYHRQPHTLVFCSNTRSIHYQGHTRCLGWMRLAEASKSKKKVHDFVNSSLFSRSSRAQNNQCAFLLRET